MNECYGIPAATIARICKVDIRTARRWKSGERRMPETARMVQAGDLGTFDSAWRGWALRGGKLISPEGWELSPGDVLSIPLMRAQINTYQAKESRCRAWRRSRCRGPRLRSWHSNVAEAVAGQPPECGLTAPLAISDEGAALEP